MLCPHHATFHTPLPLRRRLPGVETLASQLMAGAAAVALMVAAAVLSPAYVVLASNLEGDTLYALRRALADPRGVLQS